MPDEVFRTGSWASSLPASWASRSASAVPVTLTLRSWLRICSSAHTGASGPLPTISCETGVFTEAGFK
eukprot:SM000100S09460  [mRNA]  locus=s100:411173:411381:+ [translate_table: standard]